jgi:hypothetical protein
MSGDRKETDLKLITGRYRSTALLPGLEAQYTKQRNRDSYPDYPTGNRTLEHLFPLNLSTLKIKTAPVVRAADFSGRRRLSDSKLRKYPLDAFNHFGMREVTRPRHVQFELTANPRRPLGEHNYTVSELYCFFYIVSDQNHRARSFAEHSRQLDSHSQPRKVIE